MKRKLKRIVSIAIAVVMLVAFLPSNVLAADGLTLSAEHKISAAGEYVFIEISIAPNTNPGLQTLFFNVHFDPDILVFVDACNVNSPENRPIVPLDMMFAEDPSQILFLFGIADAETDSDGLLVTIEFRVQDNAPIGQSPVTIEILLVANSDFDRVPDESNVAYTEPLHGSVTIVCDDCGYYPCQCPPTLYDDETTINNTNLTRTITVGGTATGPITYTHNLPAGVTMVLAGDVITITGVRPAAGQSAITGTFTIEITREGVTAQITVNVHLTPLPGGGNGANGDNGTNGTNGGGTPWPPLTPPTPPLQPPLQPPPPPMLEDPPPLYDLDLYVDDIDDLQDELFIARFIVGYPDGNFVPAGSMTRAETAVLVVRTLTTNFGVGAYQVTGTAPMFSDVSPDAWYFGYIATAYRYGLVLGFPDGSFMPYLPITREQFAALLARTTDLLSNGVLPYTDAGDISYWAGDYVYTVLVNDWMHGDAAGTFRPLYTIRRAEAVAAICRILERTNTTSHSFRNVTDSVRIFPDVSNPSVWYFYYVVDATNSRWFVTDGRADVWTRIRSYDGE